MVATSETRDRLTELVCPTLVPVGEHDADTPPRAARVIGERITGAQVEVIAGAAGAKMREQSLA